MTPLRQQVIEDMIVRNLAPTTQATYVHQISMFARHFDCSPESSVLKKFGATKSIEVQAGLDFGLVSPTVTAEPVGLRRFDEVDALDDLSC